MKRSTALVLFFLLAGPAAPAAERIPMEISGYHAFIEVLVEGTPLSFAFDSGAGGVGINLATADELGLAATGSGAVAGAAGSAGVPLVGGLRLRLGELRLDGVTAALVALDHLEEVIGRPVDGIIGRDVLEGRLVVLDHDRNVLEIHERSTFPFEPWGEPCRLTGIGPIAVAGEIRLLGGEILPGTFHVDTGAGSFLNLGSAFVRAHGLTDRVGSTYARKGRGLTGTRGGNRVGSVAGVRLCGHELRHGAADRTGLPTLLSGATSGVLSHAGTAGLIGNAVLLRFNIAFDLERQRIYLRRNHSWSDPIRADASGLHLIRRPDGTTLVDEVARSSPAAEASLVTGDELRAIDGEEISALALAAVRDRLREPARTLVLVVARDGKLRTVDLHTRPLLDRAPARSPLRRNGGKRGAPIIGGPAGVTVCELVSDSQCGLVLSRHSV